MGTSREVIQKKKVVKMLGFGLLTVVLYAAVFTNQSTVMLYFTKGRLFATLPILTAFAFSFAHGNFTGYFWHVLGIEASRRSTDQKQEQKQPVEREQVRPRLRMRA